MQKLLKFKVFAVFISARDLRLLQQCRGTHLMTFVPAKGRAVSITSNVSSCGATGIGNTLLLINVDHLKRECMSMN